MECVNERIHGKARTGPYQAYRGECIECDELVCEACGHIDADADGVTWWCVDCHEALLNDGDAA